MFFPSSPCLLVPWSFSLCLRVSVTISLRTKESAARGSTLIPERREFDMASATGGLSILPETGDRPAASREVIADGE
jgi:hypothetical protein